jgi:hypothetical protein
MKVAVVARPIASAGYSFVRFIGGAIAPYLAARLGEVFNPHVPFFFGAAAIVLALVVLLSGGRHLGRIDAPETERIVPGPAEPAPVGGRAVAGGHS